MAQNPRFAFLTEIIPQPVTLETILQMRKEKEQSSQLTEVNDKKNNNDSVISSLEVIRENDSINASIVL